MTYVEDKPSETKGSTADAPACEAHFATRLRPLMDAIAACLREGSGQKSLRLALAFPASTDRMVYVSVRAPEKRCAPRRPGSRGLDARQLRLVDETISTMIEEPLSVSMLSSAAGLSRSHFSHAFRATVGTTPHAYVIALRLERAKKLMLETDASLGEVAAASGFADQAHFSNTFRRSTGMTPRQWRLAESAQTNALATHRNGERTSFQSRATRDRYT